MDLLRKLPEVFKSGRRCVLNTDLDGAISGALLAGALGWSVIGWCDARGRRSDALWLAEDVTALDDVVFVDVFVSQKEISAVDQHYVAGTAAVADHVYDDNQKVNPNVANRQRIRFGRSLYTQKFPFGTTHMVLAILEYLGLVLPFDLNAPLDEEEPALKVGHLIMRCDDALGNTVKYRSNSSDWWNWLEGLGGDLTVRLARWTNRYLEPTGDVNDSGMRFPTNYTDVVETLHKPISRVFERHGFASTWNRYGREGSWEDFSHADFSTALIGGTLKPEVKTFLANLFSMFGCDGSIAEQQYRKYQAKFGGRTSWEQVDELLERPDLFSYAFVDMSDHGLSYTLFDQSSLPAIRSSSRPA